MEDCICLLQQSALTYHSLYGIRITWIGCRRQKRRNRKKEIAGCKTPVIYNIDKLNSQEREGIPGEIDFFFR